MTAPNHIVHPIPPLYDRDCRLLILGSFPSVKSREARFFYGHPQNRFWPMLARLLGEEPPCSIEQKKALALRHHIALWDSIESCTVVGSSDSSVRDVKPNDLTPILQSSRVTHVACNGALSYTMYQRYLFPVTGIEAIKLPSTSPANAAFSMERLLESWSVILPLLDT